MTVGALLIIWSVVESESHIQKTLLKLIRNPIFSVYELSHRRFWEPSELLEPSGDVSTHLEPSGVIWSYPELSGPIRGLWSHLEPSEAVWSHLQRSGAIWSYLDIWNHLKTFEGTWSHLEAYRTIWSRLEPSQAILTHLRVFTGACHHMLSCVLIRCYSSLLDVIRLAWSRFDLICVELIRAASI